MASTVGICHGILLIVCRALFFVGFRVDQSARTSAPYQMLVAIIYQFPDLIHDFIVM